MSYNAETLALQVVDELNSHKRNNSYDIIYGYLVLCASWFLFVWLVGWLVGWLDFWFAELPISIVQPSAAQYNP